MCEVDDDRARLLKRDRETKLGVEGLDRPGDCLLRAHRLDLSGDLLRVDHMAVDRREPVRTSVAVGAVAVRGVQVRVLVQGSWPGPVRAASSEQRFSAHTAHSPSPRSTLYGSERLQSMKSL